MKKIILPSLLAAVVVFIWMFISWAVLPWHYSDMKNITDQALLEHIKSSLTEPGIYLYPGEPAEETDAGMEKWFEQYKAGPLIHFMVYNPQGSEWNMAMPMINSFLINFISAFIAATLLMMTLAQNPSFRRRVIFVMLLGLFAGFVGPFIMWNWWKFPFGFTIVGVIDLCVTWFLAGLVLAWKIKP
ncbi:MAG: hypothetical protein HND39_02640 [Ignavibacteriota bacterium]|nr:MAG: hypothetical protein EDM72_10670 [Chlorobiota bacterium]MBE7475150.1 hypothetical protein [Ignavibacteriales bacterium]MBL1122120.1 hypothetical protein [Ignavibacteriota bacterium]MCE7857892.1 hypothetical protein [Ignavibacteria bacterium CHB3]MCZ7616091.1 hypothetical protein [Ignavibacteriaceae bacterium]